MLEAGVGHWSWRRAIFLRKPLQGFNGSGKTAQNSAESRNRARVRRRPSAWHRGPSRNRRAPDRRGSAALFGTRARCGRRRGSRHRYHLKVGAELPQIGQHASLEIDPGPDDVERHDFEAPKSWSEVMRSFPGIRIGQKLAASCRRWCGKPAKMALVEKADLDRGNRGRHAVAHQLLRLLHPHRVQIAIGRNAHLAAKDGHEAKTLSFATRAILQRDTLREVRFNVARDNGEGWPGRACCGERGWPASRKGRKSRSASPVLRTSGGLACRPIET